MKKQPCNHELEDLVLHYYGELEDIARQEISARLMVCTFCADYYASLLAMESVLPRTPSVEPDETVMAAIRAATANRISEHRARRIRGRFDWGGLFSPPMLPRLATALAVLVVSFFLGRMTSNPDSFSGLGLESGLPAVTKVSDILYDSESGMISVKYRTAIASSVEGYFSDAAVRSLLEHALTDAENPAGRLRAARMLAEVDIARVVPDQALVNALGVVLREESNVGMQIQAVKALRRISSSNPLGEDLTAVLLEMLETAGNSALRMEVLGLLTESELARQELTRILTRATTDENSFIRFRAQSTLDDLGESDRLERMN